MGEQVGVAPPPPGVTPDFDYSHPWKYKTDLVIVGVGLTLSTLFLAMRVFTRACLLSKLGWDDGLLIFVCVVLLDVLLILFFLNSINSNSLGRRPAQQMSFQ